MKLKRLIPILFSFSLLATGCSRGEQVKDAKQKTAKGSMITVEFLQKNSENFSESPYVFKSKSIIEGGFTSNYVKVDDSSISSYGFKTYRNNIDGKYYYYSFHQRAFVEASNTNNYKVMMGTSSSVGRYIAIYNSDSSDFIIYSSLGKPIAHATNPSSYVDDRYIESTGMIHLEYYDSSYQSIDYNPTTGESGPAITSSTIGDYIGNISLADYGHPDLSLRYQERKVDLFQNSSYIKSYSLPYSKDYIQILGDNLVFMVDHQLPFDAKKYQYSTNSGYGMPVKSTQEIYLLNYINGQRTSLTSEYYISNLDPMKDSAGNLTVASASFYEIRSDKTLSPSARKFLIDSNFTIYDDITNVDIADAKAVSTDSGTYFITSSGKVYDGSLNVYRDFSTDLANFNFSSSGKYIIGQKGGKYGIANIHGEVVLPFVYDNLYFDPDLSSSLIGLKDGTYYSIVKENGSFDETISTITSVSDGGSFSVVTTESTKEVYSQYGESIHTFSGSPSVGPAYSDQSVTIKLLKVRYCTLDYDNGMVNQTLLMKFAQE